MGAYGFFGSSNSLARDCLDLSKWHGHIFYLFTHYSYC